MIKPPLYVCLTPKKSEGLSGQGVAVGSEIRLR
jgi:hypothetical protein